MKICVISSTVFPIGAGGLAGYGGLEQIAWLIAKGLAEKGHEVSLVAPNGSECPGCNVIQTGEPGKHDEKTAYNGYWQYLHNFDAVIDHSWAKYAYILKMEGKLKAPVLGVCHAPINSMFTHLPVVEKPCFVCISQDQAAHFEAIFNQPARVAYNGVDTDFYKPIGVQRSNRFLFLARFSSVKGPDLAIGACRKVGVGLDLIGDTSITNEPELLKKCVDWCDGKQIKMVGPAKRGECVWWFSQAHVLIHPNKRFREPFGLAPVEAMACGTPVIAWDNGAMRETISCVGGLLVKSMKDLVHAIEFYKEHGVSDATREACIEQAGKFSIARMVNRYEDLCHEAISGGW